MTEEIDLDAFLGMGEVVELEPPVAPKGPDPALEAAVAREAAALHQMTLEGGAEPVRPTEAGTERYITAIVFSSRSGNGPGHVVSIIELANGRTVSCICPAMRNLSRRPQGCWAMGLTRRIAGIELAGGG